MLVGFMMGFAPNDQPELSSQTVDNAPECFKMKAGQGEAGRVVAARLVRVEESPHSAGQGAGETRAGVTSRIGPQKQTASGLRLRRRCGQG